MDHFRGEEVTATTITQYLAVLGSIVVTLVWAYAVVNIALNMRSIRGYKAYSIRPRYSNSSIAVVVVARNEAHNLKKLLPTLLSCKRFSRVILVDDGSNDDTPGLARELSMMYQEKLVYVRLDNIPKGWAPKSYALFVGASRAREDVLFFIDADIQVLNVDTLSRLVLSTPSNAILGFVPRFYCKGVVCKASEAVMTALAYGFYGLHKVVSKKNRLAWMYGCCWAIHRDLYESLSGHRVVKDSIVEDRAFASHAKRSGVNIVFIDARDFLYVKAYEDFTGYANLIARLYVEPLTRRGAITKALFAAMSIAVLYSPLAMAILAILTTGILKLVMILPLLLQLMAYGYGACVEGYNPAYALLSLFVQASIATGLWYAVRSRVYWKGRRVA
jgi:glycosyltransferase involved in cell wall biosynthesis